MADKLDEFLKKIHDSKNNLPLYITIIVRPGKKLIDFKIKKEDENILRVIAHEEKTTGYFIHSFHIPIKNLGLSPKFSQIYLIRLKYQTKRLKRL